MIKFFRHIRKSLIEQNKMDKYIKYALGEILLVVIGILIALQINNWNEGRKDVRWEEQFLMDLRNELNTNLFQLQHVDRVQNAKYVACLGTKKLIQEANPDNKRLLDSTYANTQRSNPTFFPTTGVYDAALSAGKIEKIKNDNLKYAIMNLYNHFYKRLVYNGEILDDIVEKVDWEKIKYYNESIEQTRSWEAAMHPEFLAQIDFLLAQLSVYNRLTAQNVTEIERVIALISKELDGQ